MARPRKIDQISGGGELVCDDKIVHVEAVRAARARIPAGDRLGRLGELFSTLGDVTRLRIVASLLNAELCVCDLAATVGASESAVSHHLRSMRGQGLVRARRNGRLVYYALDDDHVAELYRQGIDHVGHATAEIER
jgi:DNA-binding transcriptional ArsR family regulator